MSKLKIFLTPFLFLSLALGIFIRSYQLKERFMYAHDNDLASWMVKDIVFDHHLRLIGQLTSSPGIFIGPLYYYLLIPFYQLTNWDPIGTVWFSVLVGGLAIVSIYYVFYQLYGRIPASIAAFIHAVSWGIAATEREVVPTTPVYLWCIWFFYAIHLLFRGNKKGLLYSFILMALVWHLNLALGLLFPLILIALFIHRRKYILSDFIKPLLVALVISLPLIFFETRHNFSQTQALFGTLFGMGSGHMDVLGKILHVVAYVSRNATWLFYWDSPFSHYLIPGVLIFSFVLLLLLKKYYEKYSLLLYSSWVSLMVVFFTFNSINLSEYYLNGLNILWETFAVLLLSYLFTIHKITRIFVVTLLALFTLQNFRIFLNYPNNHTGYIAKTDLVKYIAQDAKLHNYPCVSVSYMTSPGNNFGYRYLFYLAKLHVNQPKSDSPVYTIVFPQSMADRLDHSFGTIGLINPDYAKYKPSQISQSCSGANANLTDPMFGFTN